MGSGMDGLGGSGVGVGKLLVGVGAGETALGVAGFGSGLGLDAGFGSAGLRATLGSGLATGLSFSAGLGASSFAFSGCSGVFSGALASATGLGLVSAAGVALGEDSAADGGLALGSGAAEIVTAVDSDIGSGASVSVSSGRAVLKPTPESLVSRLLTPTSLEETSRP